jgi:hypothetical protein
MPPARAAKGDYSSYTVAGVQEAGNPDYAEPDNGGSDLSVGVMHGARNAGADDHYHSIPTANYVLAAATTDVGQSGANIHAEADSDSGIPTADYVLATATAPNVQAKTDTSGTASSTNTVQPNPEQARVDPPEYVEAPVYVSPDAVGYGASATNIVPLDPEQTYAEPSGYAEASVYVSPDAATYGAPVVNAAAPNGPSTTVVPPVRPTSSQSGETHCQRPSPNGGTCKYAAEAGSLFCTRHRCPHARCSTSKSAKAKRCAAHGGDAGDDVEQTEESQVTSVASASVSAFGVASNEHNYQNTTEVVTMETKQSRSRAATLTATSGTQEFIVPFSESSKAKWDNTNQSELCVYRSANRPCMAKAVYGQLHCTKHKCETNGCVRAKSSKDTMCSKHMAEDAARPTEEHREVTSVGDGKHTRFGETKPHMEMDARSTTKEASDTSSLSMTKMKEAKTLLDSGFITKKDYNEIKASYLAGLSSNTQEQPQLQQQPTPFTGNNTVPLDPEQAYTEPSGYTEAAVFVSPDAVTHGAPVVAATAKKGGRQRGGGNDVPISTPSALVASTVCVYQSRNKPCTQPAVVGQAHCAHHTCETAGCVEPKSSTVKMCSEHNVPVPSIEVFRGFDAESNDFDGEPPAPVQPTSGTQKKRKKKKVIAETDMDAVGIML